MSTTASPSTSMFPPFARAGTDPVARKRNWLVATQICSLTLLLLLALSEPLRHWFVIPVLVSGILITKDAIDWLRGDQDPLDPVGLFGIFGLHFFFFSYLLHVLFDFWWNYPYPPADWRPWLGYVAALNCVGLVLYRLALSSQVGRRAGRSLKTIWRINEKRLALLVGFALIVSFAMQWTIYRNFGGMFGMVEIYMQRGVGENPFAGMGWMAALAETFPVLFIIGVAVLTRRSRLWNSQLTVAAVLFGVFLATLYFGGLKGSRSNIFFTILWAAGVLHLWVRPIGKKTVVVAPLLLFLFMNTYLFYKRGGIEGLMSITDPMAREELASERRLGSPELFILLHDFARADINALVLYSVHTADDYDYSLGRSYLAAVVSVIPRAVWPDRPDTLGKERSDLLFGRGSAVPVSYAIGLAGEAMMNFGPLAVPLTFAVLALVIIGVRRVLYQLHPEDGRRLLMPLLLILCFVVPMGEFESVMYTMAKNGLVPLTIVFLSSKRFPASTAEDCHGAAE